MRIEIRIASLVDWRRTTIGNERLECPKFLGGGTLSVGVDFEAELNAASLDNMTGVRERAVATATAAAAAASVNGRPALGSWSRGVGPSSRRGINLL